MLITAFVQFRPKGHREPRNEVGSLSPADRLVGFEAGTFRFCNDLFSNCFEFKIVSVPCEEEQKRVVAHHIQIYCKVIFDSNVSRKYLATEVFYFKKLIAKERNPQRITTPKESVNKQKFQAEVVITAMFYFIFSYQLRHSLFNTARRKKGLIISKTYQRFHRLLTQN